MYRVLWNRLARCPRDGGSGNGSLGAQCTSNAECDSGLTCELPGSNDFDGGGPARGYCTVSCTQNSDCTSFDSTAQCVNVGGGNTYCLEGCDPAGSNQCQGRYDSLCLPLTQTGNDGGVLEGGASVSACIPECATDNDCGGRKCDLSTGLCSDNPKTGQPVGTDCDPTASTDPCAGFCIGFQGQPADQGTCTAFCSGSAIGIPGSCGSNPQQGSPQDAACLFQATFSGGGSVGICSQLCDCDSDCLGSNMVCESWANAGVSNPSQFTTALGKAGLCVSASDADGGTVAGINCTGGTGGTSAGGTGGTSSGGTAGTGTGGTGATATTGGTGATASGGTGPFGTGGSSASGSSSSSSCSCAVVGADSENAALGGGLLLLGLGLMLRRRRRR